MISGISLFLIGFSVCWYLVMAIYLLSLKERSRLQKLLGLIFVWWCISTFKDIFLHFEFFDVTTTLQHIYFIDGFGAITFTLILFELTMPGWVTLKRTLLLGMPFVLFLILHLVADSELLKTVYTVFFVSLAWCSFIIAIYKGRSYAKAIRDMYSNLEDVDISWMWTIMAAFFICQHVWWLVADSLNPLADSFYYISSLVCWGLVMYNINRMRSLRLPDLYDKGSIVERKGSQLSKSHSSSLAGKVEEFMEKEEPYVNPELTLSLLAEQLGTNRTYLSDYISNELDSTFYDYINNLRIERKVIPMLQDRNHPYTIEFIAEQAGFKSITTFRRAFKKLTGMLPSEYMQQMDN
ncbi:MAG: AraC family transcriptional regulator [Bacteroidaceae bacterium]|nr:AraC family transcriptional regulator [Bacteroidaceae bacterium]